VSSGGNGAGRFWATLGVTAVASLAVHAGALALAARLEPPGARPAAPVEVEFEVVEPPPPAPPARALPPPPPPPPAPKKVDFAKLPPPPRDEPPPPPPPPNDEPPKEEPPARPVLVTGLNLNSTVESGAVAVQVGNTLYGKAPDVAVDPKSVKSYSADGTAPPQRVTRPPRCLPLEERDRPPYPKAAAAAGIEGVVKLVLTVDVGGQVSSARVVAEPGYGLGDAARSSVSRIRCSPGLLEGEPVIADVTYSYRFTLD
jgi:protein TonB